jgi:hypothetical protein
MGSGGVLVADIAVIVVVGNDDDAGKLLRVERLTVMSW